ncbi:MAG: hypothetical protein Q8Q74_09450 [Polaromonas sp.]|nr:hypothetical protein [Polaromonas sp.]
MIRVEKDDLLEGDGGPLRIRGPSQQRLPMRGRLEQEELNTAS